ncbi:MAG: hypothetical protein PUK70_10645 [Bacteroidales bacterium]|nr:hypothetical protein [Bacteroidales bacterium]MDY6000686.1 hypothetical protein [Candidatus Cryptobacteroides sp.]
MQTTQRHFASRPICKVDFATGQPSPTWRESGCGGAAWMDEIRDYKMQGLPEPSVRTRMTLWAHIDSLPPFLARPGIYARRQQIQNQVQDDVDGRSGGRRPYWYC